MKKFATTALMFWTSMVIGVAGCASGGFKLTRQYAGFVNKQDTIIRVVLYILTMVVFAVTLLIDMVIFNTMDFWDGRVSEGKYEFNKDGKQFVAHHRHMTNGLRESRIEIFDGTPKIAREVILREQANGKIDVIIDGVLKAQVEDIRSLPTLSYFDAKGNKISSRSIFTENLIANAR